MGGSPLAVSCTSPSSIVCPRSSPGLTESRNLSFRLSCALAPGGITSPSGVEYALQWQGRWKNHSLCKFWQWAPKKCYRKLKQRHRTLSQESNALLLYYWHRLSGLVSKGSAPGTKGSHFMYPWKQVTEAIKKSFHSYMVICNSIG
jgi:hypothetical protein